MGDRGFPIFKEDALGIRSNKLATTLVTEALAKESLHSNWRSFDLHERSKGMVKKLSKLYIMSAYEQERDRLISLIENYSKSLNSITPPSAWRASEVKKLQNILNGLKTWTPAGGDVDQNVAKFKDNAIKMRDKGKVKGRTYSMCPFNSVYVILESSLEGGIHSAKSRGEDPAPFRSVRNELNKIRSHFAGINPMVPMPVVAQGDLQDRFDKMFFPGNITEIELRNLREFHNEISQFLGPNGLLLRHNPDDPKAKDFDEALRVSMYGLNEQLQKKNASVHTLLPRIEAVRKVLQKIASAPFKSKVASTSITQEADRLDAELGRWNSERLASNVRQAQNSLYLAVQKLEGSKIPQFSPLATRLRGAWGELETVDANITRTALSDLSDNLAEMQTEELAEELDKVDPEELSKALEEVLEKSAARGKKSPGKKTVKRKKNTKKKRPAIGDDPWCGKKQTFDSAFKKVDRAKTQLANLMGRLAETSLVRGDVRYALSMLEKVLEAMQRC